GDQARPLYRDGAGGGGDQPGRARDGGSDRLSAQPDGDRAQRLDAADAVPRPLYPRARLAGEGPYRAALWHALVGAGTVAARVRAGAAGDLGLLAERNKARLPGRPLQAEPDGAAVCAGAD